MAAVLACGPGAVASHRTAVALWSLLSTQPNFVEVTVTRAWQAQHQGIRVHTAPGLGEADIDDVDGIPVSAPARTIFDFASCASAPELERAVATAIRRHLVAQGELEGRLAENRGRRGVAKLRTVLGVEGGPALTRSVAEDRMLMLLRRNGFHGFEVNAPVAGFEVDFVWRRERVIVEVEGYAFHSDPSAFEWDRSRGAELAAHGYAVIRVTWHQLVQSPTAVVTRLRRALSGRTGDNP